MLEKASSARDAAWEYVLVILASCFASIAMHMLVTMKIMGIMLIVINVSFHWIANATINEATIFCSQLRTYIRMNREKKMLKPRPWLEFVRDRYVSDAIKVVCRVKKTREDVYFSESLQNIDNDWIAKVSFSAMP
jgi:hypothetical protein